ncbi:methyl-accepting chemotaxis sensory transducer with Cache sensor [Caloramator quimbayensis]|uniref:Methyl-accepting chemotaxis sensory transducer with Cache sensor n=1 Tax=Caloramator quimbayensis TaxID=1147123 RepID=A0A1T4WLJ3_9CLOT|nr:methyl-accepting chemotaxis protein [Caloramator quimbayensis]SKA78194.1 methyl-accepting chemotaxis sensory transducer with Cache sensor [Caloramator quimbayensis]
MKLPKLKSVRLLIIIAILPISIIAMILLTAISYNSGKTIINREIGYKMNANLDSIVKNIDKSLSTHSKLVESLAKSAESTGVIMSNEHYEKLLKGVLSTNPESFGAGIWFEPNKYKEGVKYFGPYVYREEGKIVYTEEYSSESYDYFKYDWYKIGKNIPSGVAWSDAYYDEVAKTSMITATAPFFDSNKNFIGVATADISLKMIQNSIGSIKIGNTGSAFLIDKNGIYIADKDSNKIMKKKITDDANSDFSSKASVMLTSKEGNFTYKSDDENYRVYFKRIPQTNWIIALTISEKELFSPVRQLLRNLIIVISAASFFVILILLLFSNYLTKNIKKVNELAFAISKGNLSNYLDVKTHDELGQMGHHLNDMTSKLKEIIKTISEGSELVVSTSEELTASAEQTQSAAEQIADSLQSLSAGSEKQINISSNAVKIVTDISKGIEQVTNNLSIIAENSLNAYDKAEKGNVVIKNTIDRMDNINEKVSAAGHTINELGKKSAEIGQIISVITGIAEQTNLLALNAAIEAARAGEHGRGFAVVADEVRKLAEQSANAAKRISTIISEIKENIDTSIGTMAEGTSAVKDGIDMVYNAGDAFNEILTSVDDVSKKMQDASSVSQQIYAASQEMVKSIENINNIIEESSQNIENVAASSQEQSAVMKEVSDAAQSLTDIALKLQESINFFKL